MKVSIIKKLMIGALTASLVMAHAKKAARSPILIGILACVLSYVGHNLFCYQTVLCTPFIFLIMGIGEWYGRQEN